MTVTAQLLRDIDSQITELQRLKEIVWDAREALDEASSASVGSSVAETLYIHLKKSDPCSTETYKGIVRSLAGTWAKERNTGAYDYRGVLLGSKHRACIIGAEPIPEPTPLVL